MSLAFSPVDGLREDDATPVSLTLPPGVAPEDGLAGGKHHYNLKPLEYALPLDVWDPRRVSCSACDWYLEDAEWCCDHDCNQAGPHYRQSSYVCKDPSDTSGKLTSKCEDQECTASGLPLLCSVDRLNEMRKADTRNDLACVKRLYNKTGQP